MDRINKYKEISRNLSRAESALKRVQWREIEVKDTVFHVRQSVSFLDDSSRNSLMVALDGLVAAMEGIRDLLDWRGR